MNTETKLLEARKFAPMLSRAKNNASEMEVRRFTREKSGVYPMTHLFGGEYTEANTEQIMCKMTSLAEGRCATHRNQRQVGSTVRPNGEDDALWLPRDH